MARDMSVSTREQSELMQKQKASMDWDLATVGLPLQEITFALNYTISSCGADSARRAGYEGNYHELYLKSRALLSKPKIRAAISALRKEMMRKYKVSASRTLREWAMIAHANIQDFIDIDTEGDGKPQINLKHVTRDQLAAVSEIGYDQAGRLKIKFHSKTDALDALSKHLGLFEKNNEQMGKAVLGNILEWIQNRNDAKCNAIEVSCEQQGTPLLPEGQEVATEQPVHDS